MQRLIVIIMSMAFAGSALAHSDSKFIKGPNGGHIVDAGGGKQHWELVASGKELTLYVSDGEEQPVKTEGGTATGQVLVGGKTINVNFAPSGSNTLKAAGDFTAAKGMKVIVKTTNVGGQSMQARLTPLQ